MKIFISGDMEGLPDIFYPPPIENVSDRTLEMEEKLFTHFVSYLANSLHNNGADEIIVSDSHGKLTNIIFESMPRYVSLIKGGIRPLDMVYGIDRQIDGAVFLGFHSASGTMYSNFDHTYDGDTYHKIMVNGQIASEYYLCSLVAGEFNVPVIMVLGDDKLRDEVSKKTPWAAYVTMKESIGNWAAIYNSLETIEKRINESSKKIMDKLSNNEHSEIKPLKIDGRLEFQFELKRTIYADVAEMIPGVDRLNGYTLRYFTDKPSSGFKMIQLISYLSAGAKSYVES